MAAHSNMPSGKIDHGTPGVPDVCSYDSDNWLSSYFFGDGGGDVSDPYSGGVNHKTVLGREGG